MFFEAVPATTALSKQDTPDLLVLFEETFQYLHTSSMCEHESDIKRVGFQAQNPVELHNL